MKIIDIVTTYLIANDFDGLFSEDGECACLTADLMPCGEYLDDCRAGYKVSCDCGECDWKITETSLVEEKP